MLARDWRGAVRAILAQRCGDPPAVLAAKVGHSIGFDWRPSSLVLIHTNELCRRRALLSLLRGSCREFNHAQISCLVCIATEQEKERALREPNGERASKIVRTLKQHQPPPRRQGRTSRASRIDCALETDDDETSARAVTLI